MKFVLFFFLLFCCAYGAYFQAQTIEQDDHVWFLQGDIFMQHSIGEIQADKARLDDPYFHPFFSAKQLNLWKDVIIKHYEGVQISCNRAYYNQEKALARFWGEKKALIWSYPSKKITIEAPYLQTIFIQPQKEKPIPSHSTFFDGVLASFNNITLKAEMLSYDFANQEMQALTKKNFCQLFFDDYLLESMEACITIDDLYHHIHLHQHVYGSHPLFGKIMTDHAYIKLKQENKRELQITGNNRIEWEKKEKLSITCEGKIFFDEQTRSLQGFAKKRSRPIRIDWNNYHFFSDKIEIDYQETDTGYEIATINAEGHIYCFEENRFIAKGEKAVIEPSNKKITFSCIKKNVLIKKLDEKMTMKGKSFTLKGDKIKANGTVHLFYEQNDEILSPFFSQYLEQKK